MRENKKYVELIWHQKYDRIELGEKLPIEKPSLPFQVVETINEPRAKDLQMKMFAGYPENYPKNWKNLLIWGDNKLVMSSLIKQGWAGKINLIYIDPPFFTAKLGISQDKLSKLAGITLHTITKIESGATPDPRIETVPQIANILGVCIGDLMR